MVLEGSRYSTNTGLLSDYDAEEENGSKHLVMSETGANSLF